MIPFQKDLTTTCDWDTLKAIKEQAPNMMYSADIDNGAAIYQLMHPLAILNPTKKLAVTYHKHYSLSAAEATDDFLASILETRYAEQENEYTTKILYLKRGATFVYNFLTKVGFTFLDRISLYLQCGPHHKIKAYKKGQKTIIISSETSDDFQAQLFSAIPLLYKEEFTWEEDTINYFRNISDLEKTRDFYSKNLKKHKTLETIKITKLKNMLGFTINYSKKQHENKLKIINNDIYNYERKLTELYRQQNEVQALITFSKATQDITEITEYILNNPYIVDYYANSERYFIVAIEAPLEYIDALALKKMLSNTTSYLYPHWSATNNVPTTVYNHETDFIKFLKDLFLKGTYKVYTRSEIVFDFENKEAYPLRKARDYTSSSLSSTRPKNWLLSNRYLNPNRCITPHMHIEHYDCWSGNKTNISKCLNKGDIIGALDIAISTTKDINVNDGAVFGRFISHGLYNPNEVPRGTTSDIASEFAFAMPGDQFKTIYDTQKKCFRTFDDIFQNDYLQGRIVQTDFEEDFSEYII